MAERHKGSSATRTSEDARVACACCSRAMLPEVMRSEDVAAVLGLASPSAARRRMNTGGLGRVVKKGRRIYILRDEFLAALRAAQEDPATRQPPDWAQHLRRGPQTGAAQLTA